MEYHLHTKSLLECKKSEAILLPINSKTPLCTSTAVINEKSNGAIKKWLQGKFLTGEAGTVHSLYHLSGIHFSTVYLVEIPEDSISAKAFESLLQKAYSHLVARTQNLLSCLCECEVTNQSLAWKAMKSIYWLNELSYTSNYLKTSTLKKNRLSQLILAISAKEEKNVMPILHQMHAQNEAMTLCKDLANAPGNLCTPTYLAHQAKALAKKYKTLSVSVMDEKELKKEGMGLILAVSQGTKQPPQLITLQHNGSPKKMKPIVLIGKGVTFDTGGINLKTGAGMDEMRYDMCGAATVFAIMQAAAEMKWPINLIGVAVAVENFPAYEAVKPGDIVKSLSGKTVEILNTDAEGRLILADALTYVSRFQPRFVFDIATLTSSIVNALGGYGCGIFSEDDELAHALCHAGDATGDRAWRMPMWAECDDELKTPFADLSNISFTNSAYARSIVAARFLAQFAKNYRWAHIDIAGIAWRSGRQKGATGRPIPLLMNFFCEQLKKL